MCVFPKKIYDLLPGKKMKIFAVLKIKYVEEKKITFLLICPLSPKGGVISAKF